MKTTLLVTVVAIAVFSVGMSAQRVTITPKKVTYTRKKPISDYKKTFEVTYPKVKAATPALSKKIEAALSYEKALEFKLSEELGDLQWLESATYDAVFNNGKVLSVNLNIEGSGAYPDGSTKTVVVDTSTGTTQTPSMVFTRLPELVAMIKKDQKLEIGQAIINLRNDPDMKDPDPATLFEGKVFTPNDLSGFAVDGKGVTFHFDYGFPHVIQAAEPSGYFFYRWDQMKRFIKPRSVLAALAR